MPPPTAFANYPEPEEGPKTGYESPFGTNPVLRGVTFSVAAAVITRLSFIQQALWNNTGFGKIKDMRILDDMPTRFNPAVTPLGERGPMLEFEPRLLKNQHTNVTAHYYTISDYHEMYKSGQVTPLQVVEALLPLTKKGQDPPSEYADAWAETHGQDHLALEAAKASTERWAAGKPLGVLDGVPIGVKDDTDVKGYRNHNGLIYDASLSYFKEQEKSLWPVQKLQEAGAIVIGKNTMHEFGSDTSGCNPNQGTATNHFNKSYFPGGSSSGCASSVGAGLVPIAVGTDAGGSVRIPSTFNGIYGLKPSHHRTVQMNTTMVVTGPLAASAADLTIAYRIMSQSNPDCSVQGQFAVSRPPAPNAKRVIGICRGWFNEADADVVRICDQAVHYFQNKLGYEIVDIDIPHVPEARIAHALICTTELAELARTRVGYGSAWLSKLTYGNQIALSAATKTGAADYIKANSVRELLMRHVAFLFKKYPGLLILTPTTPIPGWLRQPGDETYGMSDTNISLRNIMYVWLANMTGIPAVSAPVGYANVEHGDGKMPVSLMAHGEWGSEEQLLAWAGEAESYLHTVYDGGRVRPKAWFDVLKAAKSS
ncbi:Fatty acid amide hydrolase [Paramyrothecium foliicola]|nr:Fatty acid amide hydrolase [Paramyrothecium foliicola]